MLKPHLPVFANYLPNIVVGFINLERSNRQAKFFTNSTFYTENRKLLYYVLSKNIGIERCNHLYPNVWKKTKNIRKHFGKHAHANDLLTELCIFRSKNGHVYSNVWTTKPRVRTSVDRRFIVTIYELRTFA